MSLVSALRLLVVERGLLDNEQAVLEIERSKRPGASFGRGWSVRAFDIELTHPRAVRVWVGGATGQVRQSAL
ncbi:hypothetical protein ACFRAR_17755 [Kitasatospora sp. NPDC056651]|uniref:hypothetical protein n=1 Tax=Kitasatospora sp. NPDC056651 TaxID=3345892 RepID=UPI0036AA1197